jgi:hypothetical protein
MKNYFLFTAVSSLIVPVAALDLYARFNKQQNGEI